MKKFRIFPTEMLVFTAGFLLSVFLAYRLNFEDGKPSGAGVFYSDKSIYYVYLPATFIYKWDPDRFPSQCDTLYRGFILDTVQGKVRCKMTCGVALLWLPFFTVTHAIATVWDLQPDGFSDFYQQMAILPPVLFLMLGLFSLRRFLSFYFPAYVTWITIGVIFAGTNLFHYGLVEGLMSHVHSFFLFSLTLYWLKLFIGTGMQSRWLYAGFSATIALAVLIRPSNILILMLPLFLDTATLADLRMRLRAILKFRFLWIALLTGFLIFLPQLIYWKYLSGSFLHYSYGDQGFDHWKNPAIAEVLFSPLNGWFIYTPMALFFLTGVFMTIGRGLRNGWLMLVLILLVTWIAGSWFMWYFGGSMGARNYVEYYAAFAPALALVFDRLFRLKNWYPVSVILTFVGLFIWYNLALTWYNPWNTKGVWDWGHYRIRLHNAGILTYSPDGYTHIQDFENLVSEQGVTTTPLKYHSRYHSAIPEEATLTRSIGLDRIFLYEQWMDKVTGQEIRSVDIRLYVHPAYRPMAGQLFAEIVDDRGEVWFRHASVLFGAASDPDGWTPASLSFTVPRWLNSPEHRIRIGVQYPAGRLFYMDDLGLDFRDPFVNRGNDYMTNAPVPSVTKYP